MAISPNKRMRLTAAAIHVMALILFCLSCSDDKPTGPIGSWVADEPISDYDLLDVWGSPDGQVFAVGRSSALLHYLDGRWWITEDTSSFINLWGVWGSSSDDVFVVGAFGHILHYDGTSWSTMESNTGNNLMAVWGIGSQNVYAVGSMGTVLHYNGMEWMPSSRPSNSTIQDVYGLTEYIHPGINTSLTTLMAASLSGYSASYNSGPWQHIGSRGQLGIWASSWRSVWAVGYDGQLDKYDGEKWTAYESGTNLHLWDIDGTAPNNVFAVGGGGTILHYNGNSWNRMNSGTTVDLRGVWAASDGRAVAVGDNGIILRYRP